MTASAHAQSCSSWISCGLENLNGNAAFERISRFEQESQDRFLQEFKGNNAETLSRLLAYKQKVERTAYTQTLRLCMGYRAAIGLPQSHDTKSSYTLAESVQSWGEVYAHGLYQAADGIAGLKADYIEMTNLGLMDFTAWFKSMYAIHFVTSSGFLYGAVHCLNTIEARELQKFAAAILSVDYEGSLAGQAALTWSFAKIAGLVVGASKTWVLQPLSHVFTKVAARWPKPNLVVAAGTGAILATDNFNCHRAAMQAREEGLQNYIEISSGEHGHEPSLQERIFNTLKVARALRAERSACNTQEPSNQNLACQHQRMELKAQIKATGFLRDLSFYKRDLSQSDEPRATSLLTQTLLQCYGRPVQGSSSNRSETIAEDYRQILSVVIAAVEAQH